MIGRRGICDGRVMNRAIRLFSAFPASSVVPEWVHLVPAGTFSGVDGRGPYTLADPAAVIAASMRAIKLPIDENHAIDLSAPNGGPSPARAWIVAMEARDDGIWGRVEWNAAGQALMADQAYRGISPALVIEKATGRVVAIARASLVNDPNLPLTSLHHRSQSMTLLQMLCAALGLASDASEEAVLDSVKSGQTAIATHATQLGAIAVAAGLAKDIKPDALVTELQSRATDAGDVTKLRTTVIALQTQLETVLQSASRSTAERTVDEGIKAGKVGLKPLRDHYIARHMADPAAVSKEIDAMPSLHSGGLSSLPRPGATGAESLSADELRVAELMGVDPAEYAKTLASMPELL
jgi:phage I-like protein